MAYGGLRVKDRAELDSFFHEIRRKNKLPKKLNDGCNYDSKSRRASSPSLPACFNPKKAAIAPVGFEYMPEERVFSKKFTNLVIRCLDPDPAKRPTARKLNRSKIFNKIREYNLPLQQRGQLLSCIILLILTSVFLLHKCNGKQRKSCNFDKLLIA